MITISILFKALTAMNFSQQKLSQSLHASSSTINAWINKDRQPTLSANTLFEHCIDNCRKDYGLYPDEHLFIHTLIQELAISDKEKQYLNGRLNYYQKHNPSNLDYYKLFMLEVIQAALDRKDLSNETLIFDIHNKNQPIIGIGSEHVIGVKEDGTVYFSGSNDFQQGDTYSWRNVIAVCAGWKNSIGLKKDGTCIAVGKNAIGNGEIFQWNTIVGIASGTFHTLGLKSDGSVVSYGTGGSGQCDTANWKDIIAIAAGNQHSVGLKSDGTVVCCGDNQYGQCNTADWKNIKEIAAAGEHTIGLTLEGMILSTGDDSCFNFDHWKNISSIATGLYHVVGLKEDGTAIATGHESNGQCDVYRWSNLINIYAGYFSTVGVISNGQVVLTKNKHLKSSNYMNTSSWKLFESPKKVEETISKYEQVRILILNQIKEIKKITLDYAPYINQYAYSPGITFEEHTIVSDIILQNLYNLSEQLWHLYQDVLPLPPITDLLLQYQCGFHDFYESLKKEPAIEVTSIKKTACTLPASQPNKFEELSHKTNTPKKDFCRYHYLPTETTYDAYITFSITTKQVEAALLNLNK